VYICVCVCSRFDKVTNDGRLELQVLAVCWDDCASARHLQAHAAASTDWRPSKHTSCIEAPGSSFPKSSFQSAWLEPNVREPACISAGRLAHLTDDKVHWQLLARGNKRHLLRHHALPGVVHLGARLRAVVAAPLHPLLPQLGQTLPWVDALRSDAKKTSWPKNLQMAGSCGYHGVVVALNE